MSEAKRGLIRICANYARQVAVVLLGVALLPLLVHSLGEEGFGLVMLMGLTAGVAGALNQIVVGSLSRELGAAFNSPDPQEFLRTYNTAVVLSPLVALLSLIVFGVLIALVPVIFNVEGPFVNAARWFLGAQGIFMFFTVALVPMFNMYLISERMAQHNLWITCQRSSFVAAALILLLLDLSEPQAVIAYGIISVSLAVMIRLIATATIVIRLRRLLLPRPSFFCSRALRSIVHVGGWNLFGNLSRELQIPTHAYLMNWWMGLGGNFIFGTASALVLVIQRVAFGITDGVGVVSARLSTTEGNAPVRRLIHHTTRLAGTMAFPAAAVLMVLAEPILVVLVSHGVEDPVKFQQMAVLLRLLGPGMAMYCVSEGWVRIFYGAGHVHRYALLLLAGGIANPLIAIALLISLPESLRYIGPAAAYLSVMVLVAMIIFPVWCARFVELRFADMFTPLIRPLMVTAVCSAPLVITTVLIDNWNLPLLLTGGAAFGILYSLAAYRFILADSDRQRIAGAVLRWRQAGDQ